MLLNKQKKYMEKAKVKTKERNARIEEVRVKGINKLDSKFKSIQQELEVSKEKNDKKIDKANAKISTTRIKEQIKEDEAPRCSKCGNKHITAQKQGFGIGKAVVGFVALGPVGSLAGGINKNKIELTCLKCGHKFKIKRQLQYIGNHVGNSHTYKELSCFEFNYIIRTGGIKYFQSFFYWLNVTKLNIFNKKVQKVRILHKKSSYDISESKKN